MPLGDMSGSMPFELPLGNDVHMDVMTVDFDIAVIG